jgi:hypothetical protein
MNMQRPKEDFGLTTPVAKVDRLPRRWRSPARMAGHVALTTLIVEALHVLGLA